MTSDYLILLQENIHNISIVMKLLLAVQVSQLVVTSLIWVSME